MGIFTNLSYSLGKRLGARLAPPPGQTIQPYYPGKKRSLKEMVIKSKNAKNLVKKERKAQRRNRSRLAKGKPTRRYLASRASRQL